MLAQPHRDSTFAGDGTSGCTARCGKLSRSHQRQLQRARLLAVIGQSRAHNDQSCVQHATAPATPSSVDWANRYNQRSAKKLQLKAVATVAEMTLSPINKLSQLPKLPSFVEQVLGGEHIPGGLRTKVVRFQSPKTMATNTPFKDSAESMMVVCPSSMFDVNDQGGLDDLYFCCMANRLCQSVGDQTLQMCICINRNVSAHLVCAEHCMEQNPAKELYVMSVKDLTKEGKVQ